MGSAMIFAVLANLSTPNLPNPLLDLFPGLSRLITHNGQSSALLMGTLSAVALLPVLFAVWVIGRYLKAEPDEFIRALVVRALLWGFAVTMAGDAIIGVFMNFYLRPFPLTLVNADLFWASSMIAFGLVLRGYR
jgi:hypothetical protein